MLAYTIGIFDGRIETKYSVVSHTFYDNGAWSMELADGSTLYLGSLGARSIKVYPDYRLAMDKAHPAAARAATSTHTADFDAILAAQQKG